MQTLTLDKSILENSEKYRKKVDINFKKTCECKDNHLNCLIPKDWLKSQIGV